jgi:hypothetical protein
VEAYTNAQIQHVNDANDINEAQLNSNLEANRQVLLRQQTASSGSMLSRHQHVGCMKLP